METFSVRPAAFQRMFCENGSPQGVTGAFHKGVYLGLLSYAFSPVPYAPLLGFTLGVADNVFESIQYRALSNIEFSGDIVGKTCYIAMNLIPTLAFFFGACKLGERGCSRLMQKNIEQITLKHFFKLEAIYLLFTVVFDSMVRFLDKMSTPPPQKKQDEFIPK